MGTFLRETITTLVLAAVIFFGLQATIQNFSVDGPSMNPNFHNGQLLLVNKIVYRFHEPERGDVIVFSPPGNRRGDYIKRIIGLPGESIDINDGTVHILRDGDTFPLNEPYIIEPAHAPYQRGIIPKNEYFVLGDNRNNSGDSRTGWLVPQQNIIGKAWLSIWPPEEWGLAPNYPLQEQIEIQMGE